MCESFVDPGGRGGVLSRRPASPPRPQPIREGRSSRVRRTPVLPKHFYSCPGSNGTVVRGGEVGPGPSPLSGRRRDDGRCGAGRNGEDRPDPIAPEDPSEDLLSLLDSSRQGCGFSLSLGGPRPTLRLRVRVPGHQDLNPRPHPRSLDIRITPGH